MKKLLMIVICIVAASVPVLAQEFDMDDIEDGFKAFAEDTATVLPLAANMGLNWNDAYSGGFPHLGIGLTTGAAFIPVAGFEEVTSLMADEDVLADIPGPGIPLPMYTVDGRIGLPVVPIDVVIKVGVIPPDAIDLQDFTLGYQTFGGDVRWAFFEDRGIMPDLSVGVGYTFLSGNISVGMGDEQSYDISDTEAGDELVLTDSDLFYQWNANIFDVKAQVSKKLLVLNVSAGMGYSFGITQAGGGITGADVLVDGEDITNDQIDLIEDATGVSINKEGLDVLASNNGGSFRLFGGVGMNLWILKLDLGVLYGLPSKTLGTTLNVRLQY